MTQNLSQSAKQNLHYNVSVWAGKYLVARGFVVQWHNISMDIALTEEEQDTFIRVFAKHNYEAYEAYKACMDAGLLAKSHYDQQMVINVETGLSHQSHVGFRLIFPNTIPNFFGSDHNHYRYESLYKDFPELREALPEHVVDKIDIVLSLQAAMRDYYQATQTYTRARQLLDQLPTFLRFMPESVKSEMRVTNIRRRMRSDTQLIKPETITYFAIMNLAQPMDE